MMGFIEKILGHFLGADCKHNSVNQFGEANFCPDCGEKVKINWVVIKCKQCRSLRMPKTNGYGDISPLKRFCTACGAEEWYSVKKENLAVSETFFGIPIKDVVTKEQPKPSTNVWVESPVGLSSLRPRKNIIKAKRGLKMDA